MATIRKKTFSAAGVEIAFVSFGVPDVGVIGLGDALLECDRTVGLRNVVRQVVFLSEGLDRREVERTVVAAYGSSLPVTTYVYQPPVGRHALSVELWAFPSAAHIEHHEHVSVASTGEMTWSFAGGLETSEDEKLYEGVHRTLKKAQRALAEAGGDFSRIVRTWYYIGDILGFDEVRSRYGLVNRARNEFYADMWPDLCLSPASTGIGMGTNRFALEALTLSGREGAFEVTWIDNPLQTHPHRYEMASPRESMPSFSRGAAVRLGNSVLFLISGTASIRGSDIVHPGDPRAQTEATIENIATLMGSENLTGNYGFPRGATFEDLMQFRVYVKRPEDVEAVRACCLDRFPDVPHTYLVADICWPECLVEIEGVAAFKLPEGKGSE